MTFPASPAETKETATLFAVALDNHRAGRLAEAERVYRQILATNDRYADAWHLLGVIAHQLGQNAIAADLIGKAIDIDGAVAAYHSNRGNALRGLGRLHDALAAFDAALRLEPDCVEAHSNRGITLYDLGRRDAALVSYDAALCVSPDYAEAHSNRGNALRNLGRPEGSLAAYGAALHIRPHYAEAHSNRGNALYVLGRLDAALASYDAALCFRPEYAEAYSNRGNALRDLGLRDAALASYDAALRIRPDYAEAHANRGNALRDLGRHEEALACCDAALLLRPESPEAHSNRGNALKDLGRFDDALAAYEAALAIKPDLVEVHSNLIFCLHYGSRIDGEAILGAARRFGSLFRPVNPSFANTPDPQRRLRVGLVSGDFRRHPVGYFLAPVLANRSETDVEFFCYTTQPGGDELTDSLRASADHWRILVGVSDQAAELLMRGDAIDILVDLSGHTAHNRLPLFARKPAPVQATWLGYWGTTGLAAMDYILSDGVTIPPEEEGFYSERVLRLGGGRFCYAPPGYAPEPVLPPCLGDGVVTFGSFNNLAKVGGEVIALWAAVLRAVPGSRLLLKWLSLVDECTRRRLTEAFALHGIAADRLVLRVASPHARLLAEYGDVDIALDPFPFSGGLTSCEALWMGVPVVTLPGATAPSRQTLGFLKALGQDQWAAADPDDYVRIATILAADREQLCDLRRGLRRQMAASPLCDGPGFTNHLQAAFRTIWRTWCKTR